MNHAVSGSEPCALRLFRSVFSICVATFALAACTTGALVGEPTKTSPSWPQFRGPDRDGVSAEKGLLQQWPDGGPKKVWEAVGVGAGYSSVAVLGDRLYTMGLRDDKEYVFAYDVANGKKVWDRRIGGKFGNDRGNGPRGTPTVDGEVLYALGANGDLACLKIAKGDPVWQRNVLEIFKGKQITWGLSESVLVIDDRVICMPGGPDASIVALNKKDGQLIWQSKGLGHRAGYASAVPFEVDKVRGVAHFTHEAVVGLALDSGKTLWTFKKAANGVANCANPVVSGNYIYATSDYGTGGGLLELSSDGEGGVKADEVYFSKDIQNHHGGVVLVDGALYGSSGNSGRALRLVCMDFKTGKVNWKQDLGRRGKVSLMYADGHLYCLSIDGHAFLVEANTEKYVEKGAFVFKAYGEGEFKTGGIQEKDEKPTWAHPVVVGKKLYLRDQDRIVCYDVAAK